MRRLVDQLPAINKEHLRKFQIFFWVLFLLLINTQYEEKVDLGGAAFNYDGVIDFDEAASFLRMTDLAYQSLPPREFPVPTETDLRFWVEELAPRFQSQGFADIEWIPDMTIFHDFGEDRWGSLGQAHCDEDDIWMNERFANPYTEFEGTPAWLWMTAHETAHQVVQSCVEYLSPDAVDYDRQSYKWHTESSASVAALEVLASMALEGNESALYAFWYGMRNDVALHAIVHTSIRDNRRAELAERIDWLTDDPFLEYLGVALESAVRTNIVAFPVLKRSGEAYGTESIEPIVEAAQDPFRRAQGILHFSSTTGYLEQDRPHILDATIELIQRTPEIAAWLNR